MKTRKDHRCFGCDRRLPAGTKMSRVNYADEGRLTTEYWCQVCNRYWQEFMRYDDEIMCGELSGIDEWEEIRQEIEDIQ